MSYQSFKRVLGETSLERKCRFLFGACLLLLMTGSFWRYGKVTDGLVWQKLISEGRYLANAAVLQHHMPIFFEGDHRNMVDAMTEDLENLDYECSFITLDPPEKPDGPMALDNHLRLPANKEEEEIVPALERKFRERMKEFYQELTRNDGIEGSTTPKGQLDASSADTADTSTAKEWPYEHRRTTETGEYRYYQPVDYTKKSCSLIGCHSPREMGVIPSYEAAPGDGVPFSVVKVTVSYEDTQRDINRNRATLLATAIVTVFLAWLALYIVVRYVIVKPLQHLRDVSDEIAGGNYSVRAEVQTNDEFEDLARSFNRMLRHLVEAHGELRNVNADLDAKVDELARANMQLYEANRLKSEFLANMSHELRTPLNSIIGFSDVLQGIDSLNEKQKRYVRNIGKSGRLLLDMINDILDLAKMESGKMEVTPTEFSIETVIAAQCDLVRSLAEERNIDLEVIDTPELPALFQDQSKVQQIITNLLSNAIKFTPEGGRIVVGVACRSEGQVELCVTDTGVGIAEEDREIIFEKFRQGTALKPGDSLAREYTGTGLGLSIVKELCRLLGGEITVKSELGKGSAFTVVLPVDLAVQKSDPRVETPDSASAKQPNLTGSASPQHTANEGSLAARDVTPGGSSVVSAAVSSTGKS